MNTRVAVNVSLFIIFIGILFLLTFVLSCETAFCAEMLTYKNAIRDALNISARIKVKVEDVNISDAAYRQNFAGLYPEISINSRVERYENLDKRPDQGLNTISGEVVGGGLSAWRSSIYLWGQYYISHWYKKRLEANYYEKLIDARGYDCDAEVKRILKELTDIYSALAEGDIKLKYGSEIVTRLQAVLGLKMKAFAGGQVSYEDVVKAEAEVAYAEKEIAAIRKEFKENLERLYSYTGRAYGENVEVERFISDGKKQFADVSSLIEETPEYKARMKELEAVKFKEKAATNNFWPDISLYGRYDYYGSNVNSMDSSMRDIRESSYAAGMFITLPLFDGGVRKWERKRNLYEIRKQEETIKAVVEEKNRDIKTLVAGYTELSRALKHYRNLADQYHKMLEITKKAHTLGERSVMDIAEMEKETFTVERDLKVTEHAMAAKEKRLALETDYNNFIMEHYGSGACKY